MHGPSPGMSLELKIFFIVLFEIGLVVESPAFSWVLRPFGSWSGPGMGGAYVVLWQQLSADIDSWCSQWFLRIEFDSVLTPTPYSQCFSFQE